MSESKFGSHSYSNVVCLVFHESKKWVMVCFCDIIVWIGCAWIQTRITETSITLLRNTHCVFDEEVWFINEIIINKYWYFESANIESEWYQPNAIALWFQLFNVISIAAHPFWGKPKYWPLLCVSVAASLPVDSSDTSTCFVVVMRWHFGLLFSGVQMPRTRKTEAKNSSSSLLLAYSILCLCKRDWFAQREEKRTAAQPYENVVKKRWRFSHAECQEDSISWWFEFVPFR